MSKLFEIATTLGELVERKNAAYGSSFEKSGEFLNLLYPHGLALHQYDDALLQVRIFDKQMRIATARTALGESPYQDIAGYGILGVAMHTNPRKEAPCTNGDASVAASSSPTEAASVARPGAARPTTRRNASASSDRSSAIASPPPSPSACVSTAATAESVSTVRHPDALAAMWGRL